MEIVPVLLVEHGAARVAALGSAGYGARAVDTPAAALAALRDNYDIAAVVLDLALATPELLARLRSPGAPRLLALVAPDHLDTAGAVLDAAYIDFLPSGIDDAHLIEALDRAVADEPHAVGVAELSDRGAAALGALSTEVERIAAALATIAAGERRRGDGGPPVTAVQLRAIIRARRLRDRYLPAELFQDPAWDMLLDLTAARLEDKPVSVSSLCIAAAVPTTTALRWIRTLCDTGMFVRQTDPNDARRAFIALSDATAQAMMDYLGSLRGEGPVI